MTLILGRTKNHMNISIGDVEYSLTYTITKACVTSVFKYRIVSTGDVELKTNNDTCLSELNVTQCSWEFIQHCLGVCPLPLPRVVHTGPVCRSWCTPLCCLTSLSYVVRPSSRPSSSCTATTTNVSSASTSVRRSISSTSTTSRPRH